MDKETTEWVDEHFSKDYRMIVDNAVDFFAQAVECFPGKPKNSVIFFDSAVELFVKARLMVEHWSLIVAGNYTPDRDKFKNGDFTSVSLQEAAEKLDKTIKSGLTKEELKAFEKIKAHRNKMVHFYHKGLSKDQNDKLLQEIAKEHLTASYLLYNKLFFTEWIDCFGPWIEDMRPLYDKLQENYKFLEVIFNHVQGEIANREKRGDMFTECPACGFKSYGSELGNNNIYYFCCLVCDVINAFLKMECPQCNDHVYIEQKKKTPKCANCKKEFSHEEIASILHEDDKSKGFSTPANCYECGSVHTVANFSGNIVCVNCFEVFDSIEFCEWCEEPNAGEMVDSGFVGCLSCEGELGELQK